MKKLYLVLLLQLLVHAMGYSQGGRSFELFWNRQQDAVLFFEGALFNDSLENIPFFVFQDNAEVPFFRQDFSLVSPVFEPVGADEQEILESSGFYQNQVLLYQGEEFVQKERSSYVGFYPFRFNTATGNFEKLLSFHLESSLKYDPEVHFETKQIYAPNSVLSRGTWFKLCIDKTGIFRLGFNELTGLGVNPAAIQKENIRLFGNGTGMLPEANDAARVDDLLENAIFVSGSGGSTFGQSDYILFYGRGPDQWYYDPEQKVFNHEVHLYSRENCYYLTTDMGAGKRIVQQESILAAETHTVNSFQDYAFHQRDLENLLNSGRVWYGEVFDATLTRTFTFSFPDIDPAGPARVKTYLAARSGTQSSFTVRAGSNQSTASVQPVNLAAYEGYHARFTTDSLWFTPNQPNNVAVTITYNRTSGGSRGWLNYIAVNVSRHLRYSGQQMAFRNTRVIGPGHVAEYVLANAPSNVIVWDVTDHFNVARQQTNTSGNSQIFRLGADSLRELIAFNGSGFHSARLVGKIPNQNLHAMPSHDLIIVSPEPFLEQANRLAEFRRANDGLSVAVVTPQQIYNEFSSGAADIAAIRNFMKMFYDRANKQQELPRYLLLFGNGTVDNKDNLGFGGNLIPTFQTRQSLSPSGGVENGIVVEGTHMTDDFFGLLDDSEGRDAQGVIDIGIGRLPVRTPEEATIVVDKIIRYDARVPGMGSRDEDLQFVGAVSNYADWRNQVVLIADDGDNNLHLSHSESLASYMKQYHDVYNLDKIYLDAYNKMIVAGGSRYPDVNQAINDKVNKGALMINYIGHGGVRGLADERILTFEDIATWNNLYNMPVFMTATCEFSSFDQPDPDELSAGVRIILKPDGGAIALYTTTRLAWSSSNLTLNIHFMQNAFVADENGQMPRLGDMIRVAKQKSSTGGSLNWRLRNFVLLGDPSMQMAYPRYKVVTESMPDTIRAFQEVTVTGFITDPMGNLVDDYQGVIFPTVFDKENQIRTLGNSSGSYPANFELLNSLLYKGKASVRDGRFSFTFAVPRDIAYNSGRGKISYYLDNGTTDGHGSFREFIIGGTMEGYQADTNGPQISLFLNDTTFRPGATINQNPILLAFISDESGINITGRIGHDIVAFLNEDTSRPLVLNNYFEADLDNYKSGRVVYPFFNLPDGQHTLSLRAWDIHNNASQESISFIVQSSASLALQQLMNYPNPFRDHTWFVFSHNQAFEPMQAQIDIYDLGGRLLQSIQAPVQSAGYRSAPILWDGTDSSGKPLGNGLYIYRLTLTTSSGSVTQQTEKLVILR